MILLIEIFFGWLLKKYVKYTFRKWKGKILKKKENKNYSLILGYAMLIKYSLIAVEKRINL